MKPAPPPPRPPRLDTARELVRRCWLNPTEDGLRDARRSLVRRMWRARRLGLSDLRAEFRVLYLKICEQQRQLDWEIPVYERSARYRARLEPHQVMREEVQRQGKARAIGINIPQEGQWTPPPPDPPRILHRPAPGTAMPVQEVQPLPRGRRALKVMRQMAVTQLARVLYLAHLYGWKSLALTETYGRPGEERRVPSSGGVDFAVLCPFETVMVRVNTIITTTEYRRALERLPERFQDEIRSYYRRSAAEGDVCPNVERWEYQATADAFGALLDALFEQGSLG